MLTVFESLFVLKIEKNLFLNELDYFIFLGYSTAITSYQLFCNFAIKTNALFALSQFRVIGKIEVLKKLVKN